MALQGTLDTFALADLVRLLATTSKTGELAIDGDRGSGRLWFADGQLVGGEPSADDLVDVVFALLRQQEGDFAFHADMAPDDAGEPQSALDVLAAAEARMEEWAPVEELVPSPAVGLALRDHLPADEVTIDRDRWRRLVAIGSGTTAGAFGSALDLDEQAAGFAVKDLVDAGLVEVGPEVEEPEVDELAVAERAVDEDAVAERAIEPAAELAADEPPAELPDDAVEPVVADPIVAEPAASTDVDAFAPIQVAPVPADVAEIIDTAHGAEEADPVGVATAGEPDAEPAEVPPVLGVVPDPPYSFGRWGDGPVPAPEDQPDPASLGPWEPLTAPSAEGEPLPTLEDQPAPTPVDDALPSLGAPADDLASYAVDLDSPLGGASGHSYLGTADTGATLPEPLLGAEGIPTSDAAVLSAPPEPPAPASGPEAGTGAADELAARRDHAADETWNRTASDDLGVPMDSLSPAAARALAAAASADERDDDTDAGRRVLRRIISTGKG